MAHHQASTLGTEVSPSSPVTATTGAVEFQPPPSPRSVRDLESTAPPLSPYAAQELETDKAFAPAAGETGVAGFGAAGLAEMEADKQHDAQADHDKKTPEKLAFGAGAGVLAGVAAAEVIEHKVGGRALRFSISARLTLVLHPALGFTPAHSSAD